MRILLDTNIFIYRETNQILSPNLQAFSNKVLANKLDTLIHPLSISEIENDTNLERKKINLSKIAIYSKLDPPPDPTIDETFSRLIGVTTNTHDLIDNHLIYAVYKDAVDFLVTEDKDLQKKAVLLGLENRVLGIDEAVSFIKKSFPEITEPLVPISLSPVPTSNLDIKDPIFDSLKADYTEFSDWFASISRKGRQAWVYYDDKKIGAIAINKPEDEQIELKDTLLPAKKRIKICLLKVKTSGQKIGELFLKLAFDLAIKNNRFEVYLTHFTIENDPLVSLIENYGFFKVGVKIRPDGREEDVFLKKLIPDEKSTLSPIEISKRFYPSFSDGSSVNKFIVPIKPEYHDRLFIEYEGRNTTLPEHDGNLIVEGNTITKAYICNSQISKLKPGDILIFYLSEDSKATAMGTVDSIYLKLTNPNEISRLVAKRTVYSFKDIENLAKKPVLVILFRWHFNFKKSIPLSELTRFKILKAAPQSIGQLTEDAYQKIKEKGEIDGRFAIN